MVQLINLKQDFPPLLKWSYVQNNCLSEQASFVTHGNSSLVKY